MAIFLPALYFGRRSRIFQWDIPSTTSLHDAFLLHIYQVSNLNAYAQPPRIDHICLLKNFTATPWGKTKLYMHIPSRSSSNSIKSALIFLHREYVRTKRTNWSAYWNRRWSTSELSCSFSSSSIYKTSCNISRRNPRYTGIFTLYSRLKDTRSTWSGLMLHRSVSRLKVNWSSRAQDLLTETSVVYLF